MIELGQVKRNDDNLQHVMEFFIFFPKALVIAK